MKSSLQPGLKTTRTFTIDEARTIDFLGDELRVYATPALVRDIEHACRDFLLEHAEEGEDSVGVGVEITHSAATPLGMTVDITFTVSRIEGRQVWFDIEARDAIEEIGRGKHGRFMVAVDRLRQRVAEKVEAARAR